METWIVTGGAGFIGTNFIHHVRAKNLARIINFDKLTYAGNPKNFESISSDENYLLEKKDINDAQAVREVIADHQPDRIFHFAAESHVDRSIDGPAVFIQTNIGGTFNMLEAARSYWMELPEPRKQNFRFHHVSTDEVFGSLSETDPAFSEATPYQPNSPYSASKAASDHLTRAYHHTYGLPTITTNCSNNYGPYQFPEKLLPLIIIKALAGENLPVYGRGENIRDWLYVEDHVEGILAAHMKGRLGETYNIGGNNEQTNINMVKSVCRYLDGVRPKDDGSSYEAQITFVTDRPGHDMRYAIDASKMRRELSWEPKETHESGLKKTIDWYLEHAPWWQDILENTYQGERLGNR